MKRTFITAAFAILVAACGHPQAAAPKPVENLCSAAAGNIAKIIAINADGTETLAANSRTFPALRDAIAATCQNDTWSSSVSSCYRDLATFEFDELTATPCGKQLTPAQGDNLKNAVFSALIFPGSKSSGNLGDLLQDSNAPADSLENLGSSGGGSVGSGNPASISPGGAAPATSSPPPTQSNPCDGGGYTPK